MTSDELALLAEGNAGEAAEGCRRHLAHCRSCYQAYEDAVEARVAWLTGEESPASPELLRAGRAVGVGRERSGRVTGVSWLRLAATTAGVLGLFVAGWLLYAGWKDEIELVRSQSYQAVLEPLIASASSKDLIFPGFGGATIDEIKYRGEISSTEAVGSIIDSLEVVQGRHGATPDDLFWLIAAHLASGNLGMAELYLRGADTTNDVRFLTLKAILAYRDNRLAEAEHYLRVVLKQTPDDDEAGLNLGIVLAESGKHEDAMKLLERAKTSEYPRIAKHATRAADSLSAQ